MEEQLENLRREINKGIEAMKNGNFKTYNSADEMIEDVLKEARTEFEKKRNDNEILDGKET